MDFVAIDVETANADLSSICQIGIAIFRDGAYADSWSSLVDPGEDFDSMNVAIHGIDAQQVRGAPDWPQIAKTLRELVGVSVVTSHTPFDRAATSLACRKHGIADFDWRWIDTARVVRRAWPDQFGSKGYGLANVAKVLGITFRHHDALEDARASGEVFCRASLHTGLELEAWLARVNQPISSAPGGVIARAGDAEGPLFGDVAVFTGSLSIPRREAADLAAKSGCDVSSSVTKKTTLLVVGDQDISKLAGKSKSAKHLKAEELIAQGLNIRILRESDFQDIVLAQTATG